MRRYTVLYGGGSWDAEDGETVELELEPDEENRLVAERRLEIEPVEYEVTGSSTVFGAKMGERVSQAISLEQETALVAGGHIKLAGKAGNGRRRRSSSSPDKPATETEGGNT